MFGSPNASLTIASMPKNGGVKQLHGKRNHLTRIETIQADLVQLGRFSRPKTEREQNPRPMPTG
jgi:hypothetical protein